MGNLYWNIKYLSSFCNFSNCAKYPLFIITDMGGD